ncbi:hypothetical protein TNCV_536921 [Trichonephila clavipes]|nr:hypothetical protein TNCV_536921 [Trichonephila clavipes]
MEKNAANCDGEVLAVYENTEALLAADLVPAKKVVFLKDSQDTILVLSNNTPNDLCRAHTHPERAETVARFHLTSRHYFLGLYLHWFGLVADEACSLYGHAKMDGYHQLQCTGLDEHPVVSWYWGAQCQMVKKPSTGVV